jgi:hypothetical protein
MKRPKKLVLSIFGDLASPFQKKEKKKGRGEGSVVSAHEFVPPYALVVNTHALQRTHAHTHDDGRMVQVMHFTVVYGIYCLESTLVLWRRSYTGAAAPHFSLPTTHFRISPFHCISRKASRIEQKNLILSYRYL